MDTDLTAELMAYLHGSLDPARRELLEARLREDADAKAHLEFLSLMRDVMERSLPPVAADAGLERTLKLIGQGDPVSTRPFGTGRWREWLANLVRPWPSMSTAQLATTALVAVQFGALGVLLLERERDYADTRASPVAAPAIGPFIKLSLKPDALEADVRFLLIGIGASIIGGPTQLGDYYLHVDVRRTDWALQRLQQSPVVDRAGIIATLPPAKD